MTVDPDGSTKLRDESRAVLETALAEFLTLDRALRSGASGRSLTAEGIMAQFPQLTTKYCAPSLAVQPTWRRVSTPN